jgi:hypothetical protein
MKDYTIPTHEQNNVMHSFWTMLRECETKAENENDIILKNWVAQWYQQWNRITGDNLLPSWEKK